MKTNKTEHVMNDTEWKKLIGRLAASNPRLADYLARGSAFEVNGVRYRHINARPATPANPSTGTLAGRQTANTSWTRTIAPPSSGAASSAPTPALASANRPPMAAPLPPTVVGELAAFLDLEDGDAIERELRELGFIGGESPAPKPAAPQTRGTVGSELADFLGGPEQGSNTAAQTGGESLADFFGGDR